MSRFLTAAISLFLLSSTIGRAEEDAMKELPAESQHVFTPIDPAWKTSVVFMKLRPDAFVHVDNPTPQAKKKLYKEVRYFAGESKDSNEAIKILTYYPGGKLLSESDNIIEGKRPIEQFSRRFLPNGDVSSYKHWRDRKWIAGYAIGPKTKQVSSFGNGRGRLTVHSTTDRDSSSTSWYVDGHTVLQLNFSNAKRVSAELYVGDDMLRLTPDEESLHLRSEHETWIVQKGSDPWVQIMTHAIEASTGKVIRLDVPEKTDIRSMPMAGFGRPGEIEERKQIQNEWKIAYPKRKAAFMERFQKLFDQTGESLADVGVEVNP